MDVQFEEIFSDLVNFRKEIGAELVHVDYEVEPVRFLLYNPSNPNKPGKFHFLACGSVKNKALLANWRRISYSNGKFRLLNGSEKELEPCKDCIRIWNKRFPHNGVKKKRFNIEKFFAQCGYNPDIWDGINIQDIQEIDYDTFRADCFLLYRPVGGAVFHFMKCKEVRADEKIGWIKSYRFTDDLSGGFKLFDGSKQKLPPCECCLAEWDNGNGWENYSSADDSTKKTIKDNFNIETFFDHCSEKEPRPAELSELYKLMDDNIVWLGADIDNDYPRNWSDISNMYRAAKRYRCGQCGVDLSEHKDLAVTHHVNGVHSDVSAENIKVLCVWCHSKQPHHEKTVRINRDQYLLLRRLWREQGIRFEDVS